MTFSPASSASVAAFVAIVVAVIGMVLLGVYQSSRTDPSTARRLTLRTAIGLAAWLGLLGALIASRRMTSLPLSGLPLFFGSIVAVSLTVGLTPFGARLAAGLPLAALVAFQSFRLPLELVLHSWAAQGTIPDAMTWTGRNWDIVSGVAAIAAAPFANRNRAVAWIANLVGSVLLLNVMRVALLTAPVPFGWNTTPPLLVALHIPYFLIGPVCVGGALAGHIILTRALLRLK